MAHDVDTIVMQIRSIDAKPWILQKHYAKRMPCVQYAFGLYVSNTLSGVVTYGTPSSSKLRSSLCGGKWPVIELNRLCVECDKKNAASILVGRSLKMLNDCVVVSYADTSMGHVGYVYQATNWIYTGLSAKRTDWHIEGEEGKHGQTIADKTRGMDNRAQAIRQMYGDRFSLVPRPRKHRYVYFCGNRRVARDMRANLNYDIIPYPKGDTARYNAGGCVATQGILVL